MVELTGNTDGWVIRCGTGRVLADPRPMWDKVFGVGQPTLTAWDVGLLYGDGKVKKKRFFYFYKYHSLLMVYTMVLPACAAAFPPPIVCAWILKVAKYLHTVCASIVVQ